MHIPLSYPAAFTRLMERLRREHPARAFSLDGLGLEQLDPHQSAEHFFGKGEPNADKFITDPNANVHGCDMVTFNYELPKSVKKLNSLYSLWNMLRRLYDEETADFIIEAQVSGYIYINDLWDIGRPYCFNYSMYDIALEGLKTSSRLKITPPRSLFSYLRQVEQFTVTAANNTLGATGLADMLIVASWYVDRIFEDGYDNHFHIGERVEEIRRYVYESLHSFIYTMNYEFRGNQSPFTNVSLYDTPFLEGLIPSYRIDGKAPQLATVHFVQDVFVEAYNDALERTPITFPVLTACFSVKEEAGTRVIQDQAFAAQIARANLKFGAINLYCGETSTLSSCCRLRSNVNDLGYSNTFGAGSTKIGSLGVVTLNLPRLAAEESEDFQKFLDRLHIYTAVAGAVNHAKRHLLEAYIQRGALPMYTHGYMDLSRQYSTAGFTGLAEAVEIFGHSLIEPEGLALAKAVLGTINQTNQALAGMYGTPHNMEQVPAETSSVKLCAKDKLYGVDLGLELYSNQFLPLWAEADLLDRIRIQGALDPQCSGGAICHLNLGQPITDPAVMEALIHHAARAGVIYFAVNYCLNRCARGHMSAGLHPHCPICAEPITDTYTRVVGFLTNTKHWNKTRREHDWPRRVFQAADKEASHDVCRRLPVQPGA